MGWLQKPDVGSADFITNLAFTSLLHQIVADHAPDIAEYQAKAKAQPVGSLYVVDGRARPSEGFLSQQDVLGVFRVRDGIIDRGSYQPNPKYAPYTPDGFFQLHDTLKEKLIAEMVRRCLALGPNQSAAGDGQKQAASERPSR